MSLEPVTVKQTMRTMTEDFRPALLHEDVRFSIPPTPDVCDRRSTVVQANEPLAIEVLRVQDGLATEIVTLGRAVFTYLDLPARRTGAEPTT